MTDRDSPSNLQQRLARIEADLVHIRLGKAPPPTVDLMGWRANIPASSSSESHAGRRTQAVLRCLRDDWNGLTEAIRNWGLRVEERFSR